jgi:tRNA threonylcarbamoyladenosine biosynthesis protein TsaE
MLKFTSYSKKETQDIALHISSKIKKSQIICFQGDLGAGKTTFIQAILGYFKAKKPYTSPTFVIMKKYEIENCVIIKNIYHIDAYRIDSLSLQELGWEELLQDPKNLILLEWPEKVIEIIPKEAQYVDIKWISENSREIVIKN